MKKIKIIPVILSLSLISSMLTGCGEDVVQKVNQNGEIESQSVELEQANEEEDNIPFYDLNALEESTNEISLEEGESFYKSLLDERCVIIYDDIKNAYKSYKQEIVLKKACTEKELFQIISILYIDEPMLFNMKPKYDYFLDSNGYVNRVNLYYNVSMIEYNQDTDRLKNQLLNSYSIVKEAIDKANKKNNVLDEFHTITDYNAIELLNKSNLFAAENIVKPSDNKMDYSILASLNRRETSFSNAKKITMYLRYLGIDSSVVIGKLSNNAYNEALTGKGAEIENFEDVIQHHTKIDSSNGTTKYCVEYNFNDYYAWNIIKVNGNWYHYDNFLPKYIQKTLRNDEKYLKMIPEKNDKLENSLQFVDDYTISESRTFYYSDELLGEVPLCNSKGFKYSYRNGYHVLPHNENQIKVFLEREVEKMVNMKEREGKYYQFEDEATYQYFLDYINTMINAYNQESLTKIDTYTLIELKDLLVIYIPNVKLKK